jgi:hypothetical protein
VSGGRRWWPARLCGPICGPAGVLGRERVIGVVSSSLTSEGRAADPSRASSAAAASSPAAAKRDSGFFAMLLATTASSAAGTPVRAALGFGGSALRCLYSSAGYSPPANGLLPVSIS